MKPFTFFHSARRVLCAENALERLAHLAQEFGCVRAAVVLDGFFAGGPVERRLAELLQAGTGRAPDCHPVPDREPDTGSVEACRAFLAAIDPDLIVAVGGGSALDTAKVARMLLSNPGDIAAIAGPVGVKMAPHPSVLVCVPTTAGTGSEVSESAIVAAAGTDYKMIFRSPEMTARIALLDPVPGISAPPGVTAASGYDAITHAVEAYTSNFASPMTDPLALAAMEALARWLPVAYREPDNVAARSECLVASLQAAMAFNSANLGLAHAISGALGALHHVPHGLGNALALPWTMAFNQPALGRKGETIARIFGGATAAEGLSRIRHVLGLDISLDEYVKTDGERDRVADSAGRSGQVKMNPRPSSPAELRVILEAMRRPTGGGQPHLNL